MIAPAVGGLRHVHIEPGGIPERIRGLSRSARVVAYQMRPAVSLAQTGRQRVQQRPLPGSRDILVASEHPEERRVLVTIPQIPTEGAGLLNGEQGLRAVLGLALPVMSPGRKQADRQPQLSCACQHMVHMPEIGLVGPGKIPANQRKVPVRVRLLHTALRGEHDRLDNREALGRTVSQIQIRLRRCGPVQQRPGSVRQIKKRGAIRALQMVSVRRHAQARGRGDEGKGAQQARQQQPAGGETRGEALHDATITPTDRRASPQAAEILRSFSGSREGGVRVRSSIYW